MNTHKATYNDPNKMDDEISLKEFIVKVKQYWQYLLSKWVIILIAVVFGGCLGFGYSVFQTPVYTSTYTFVFDEGGGSNGINQYSGLASIVGINIGNRGNGGLFEGENILELYKSRKMIEKALLSEIDYFGEKQLVIDRYITINNLKKEWDENPKLQNIQFKLNEEQSRTRLQDSILSIIVKDINENYLKVAGSDKNSSLIKAEVKSKDEFFAKLFNEQIVKTVNDFYIQTKTKKSLETINILQSQADSVRKVMENALYSSVATMDATPNLNLSKQVLRTSMQNLQFSAEMNKAILSELIKNLEMSKMTLLNETPLIQVVDHPVFPLEKRYLGKAKGILFGGFLFAFLTIIYLLVNLFFVGLLKD